jgi:phage tail sheath gpL-like
MFFPIQISISRQHSRRYAQLRHSTGEAKVDTQSANVEATITSTTEISGTAGVASGKESVGMSAKGGFGVTNQVQSSTQTQNGWDEQVKFTGTKPTSDAPSVTPRPR